MKGFQFIQVTLLASMCQGFTPVNPKSASVVPSTTNSNSKVGIPPVSSSLPAATILQTDDIALPPPVSDTQENENNFEEEAPLVPQVRKPIVRTWQRAIFTSRDNPHRIHAISAATSTLAGSVWVGLMSASMMGLYHDDSGFVTTSLIGTLIASHAGLVATGHSYQPKGDRFYYYRRIHYDTEAIMLADLLLWFLFGGGTSVLPAEASGAIGALAAVISAAGNYDFFQSDIEGRQEFLKNGITDEIIAKDIWTYISILPVHLGITLNACVGAAHLLANDLSADAQAFGSGLSMALVLVATWSSFTQGTMPLRKTPIMGKPFILDFSFLSFFVMMAPLIIPLAPPVWFGLQSGALQEFYTLPDLTSLF